MLPAQQRDPARFLLGEPQHVGGWPGCTRNAAVQGTVLQCCSSTGDRVEQDAPSSVGEPVLEHLADLLVGGELVGSMMTSWVSGMPARSATR
jgi:hypothetical protein